MEVFGMSALFGLILGFMFGVGCAFAVLYTIYMGGYRKGVVEALAEQPSKRFQDELKKIERRVEREALLK